MALICECIQTDGIAELSYLVGDDSAGVAAVIDPRADVDCYLDLGAFLITVRHTPGHTPEHVAYLVAEKDHPDAPWGVLTGDSLFVSSAGRPDLLGNAQAKKLAEQQFYTLREFYLKLADGVIIYPAHGHGSPCGADIGDRLSSTIGYERRLNAFLQFQDVKNFTDYALSTAPPAPTYYPRMKKVNARGPQILGNLPRVRGLPPRLFKKAIKQEDNVLIDTRTMLAFGGGHLRGALSIGGKPLLSIWAGWLLDPKKPLLLVLESDDQQNEIVRYFVRTGYTKFAGYLVGGMTAWNNAGLPLESVGQMTVHEVKRAGKRLQLFDVRSPDEWKSGHIPNARHIFLGELRDRLGRLDRTKPTAVYCDSGYRASIAACILQQAGFGCVCNIPGSRQAWEEAGLPVEGGQYPGPAWSPYVVGAGMAVCLFLRRQRHHADHEKSGVHAIIVVVDPDLFQILGERLRVRRAAARGPHLAQHRGDQRFQPFLVDRKQFVAPALEKRRPLVGRYDANAGADGHATREGRRLGRQNRRRKNASADWRR